MKFSNSCAEILNRVGFDNYIKVHCKWTITNLQKILTKFEIVFSSIQYTFPTIPRYFQSQTFVMILQLYSQLNLPLLYVYIFSSANTNLTSHKETSMHYEIRELFAWTFIMWNNLIIMYRWTLHFFQMPTHNDRSCSFLKANAKIMTFSHSPLSANVCISRTCCTIMCKHQYKANAIRILSCLSRWFIMFFFPSSPMQY